ncbi:ADP-heptose:LPS heptosyltransferase [Dyadobacter soli]|uniref:ADP-heptose:LPS heptosyltransferase n=1 Tax=Dyadobacter soli TaxID=659014 RepID=A0A1G7D1J4_9BACT|nr:glycosyltransferase family 9 protein [Dyadobacter soli]SDE45399.1 ADP-heptose:LPS heptosyltransferase [Dyadobacter soli]
MKFPAETTRKIAVFRALQLGDMLCGVPAFRALRGAYPDAEIVLLGLPWAKSFTERFAGYFDGFIHFPGYPELPEQPFDQLAWQEFLTQMRKEGFDLILQMQGNGSVVNEMLRDLDAGAVAGFHTEGNEGNPEWFVGYPEGISEIHRHLRLMEHLGIAALGDKLEFPVSDDEVRHSHKNSPLLAGDRYVCVHPGSRGAWRQWPTSHFACLADQCAGMGYQVVITGTASEAQITQEVIDQMDYPAIDLSGQTGLGEIGQLIREADLLISNCTGVSHIAAAVETPSIVISMDGEPERWGPLNTRLHKTIDWTCRTDYEHVQTEMEMLLEARYQAVAAGR